MRIASIAVYARTVTLKRPYKLSGGRLLFERLDSTFVRLETACGHVGWGEGCPWGHTYLPAHGGGIRAASELLAPVLLGQDPRCVDTVNRRMDTTLPGHLYAKAPFDIACWDLASQAAGLPICEMLGGRDPAGAPIASSVSTGTPEAMLAEVDLYRAAGYRVHSVKIGGSDTDLDIARIRHLQANRRPGETILYDVNRAWTPAEAITVMNTLAGLQVPFEQPCETLDQCLQVRRLTGQPISIDERLETETDMLRILSEGIGEIVNIKIGRVGGLTKARRLRDMALAGGIRMLVMETGGTVVADTAAVHLMQTVPESMRFGTWLCQEMLSEDPAPGSGARNIQGETVAPGVPGLGVAPDLDFLGDPVAVYS
jgi:L-alanine-DL-glutamate epimerase-like enolase superfamily enzyme